MKTSAGSALVLCASVWMASSAAAQTPVGALAIDEGQGDQYGWAVDYETAGTAGQRALSECGPGCSVVLTFERCAAYAADQEAGSTVYGWAESYESASGARQRALAECGTRGSGCTVRVWGCNGSVVEEGLGLDRALRRQVQEGLQAAGFDPGGADGMFGPRTRSAIRSWQTSRGTRPTGYLDASSVAALRPSVAGQPTFREREAVGAGLPSSPSSSEVEVVFWQSIANSTNPAEFEAYLAQFPNGVFRVLAQNRLSALGVSGGAALASARPSGAVGNSDAAIAGGVDARSGTVFQPDRTCAGQPAGASCWMEITGRPGCHVWNAGYAVGATVTWSGECSGGLAQGAGSLTWVWDSNEQVGTGQLVDGKQNGHWVLRYADGNVEEGPFVDGEENGHWVLRSAASGNVYEGPIVAGVQNGHWVHRRANGDVWEGPYVAGEWHGHWVFRNADGSVSDGPYVEGERHGDWVIRHADGDTEVLRYENGRIVGRR